MLLNKRLKMAQVKVNPSKDLRMTTWSEWTVCHICVTDIEYAHHQIWTCYVWITRLPVPLMKQELLLDILISSSFLSGVRVDLFISFCIVDMFFFFEHVVLYYLLVNGFDWPMYIFPHLLHNITIKLCVKQLDLSKSF